jgi:hypothetical protein
MVPLVARLQSENSLPPMFFADFWSEINKSKMRGRDQDVAGRVEI